jgi:nitrous oxide reductase accessory protein NosL
MKRNIFQVAVAMFLTLFLTAAAAFAETDIDQHRDCSHCGMDRKAYGYSRMLVEYRDGTQVGTCSLHCVATEMNSRKNGEITAFKVADRDSRQLIDAENAVWTIGGTKRGVMTMRAKWAFATREAAQKFVAAHGGSIATWHEALAAAQEDAAPKSR